MSSLDEDAGQVGVNALLLADLEDVVLDGQRVGLAVEAEDLERGLHLVHLVWLFLF